MDELSIIIPEHDSIIVIPEFEYTFIKYPSEIKEMKVSGRSLNILAGNNQIFGPASHEQEKGFGYAIEMKTSGEKVMLVSLNSVEIDYKLPFYMKLLTYFILDESCYPKAVDFSDLPLIVCEVHLINSSIKLGTSPTSHYLCKGDIKMIWTRNQLIHPGRY